MKKVRCVYWKQCDIVDNHSDTRRCEHVVAHEPNAACKTGCLYTSAHSLKVVPCTKNRRMKMFDDRSLAVQLILMALIFRR